MTRDYCRAFLTESATGVGGRISLLPSKIWRDAGMHPLFNTFIDWVLGETVEKNDCGISFVLGRFAGSWLGQLGLQCIDYSVRLG